jgi:hypothetical protein
MTSGSGVYLNGYTNKKGIFASVRKDLDLAIGDTVSELIIYNDTRIYEDSTITTSNTTKTLTPVTPYITNFTYTLAEDAAISNIRVMI